MCLGGPGGWLEVALAGAQQPGCPSWHLKWWNGSVFHYVCSLGLHMCPWSHELLPPGDVGAVLTCIDTVYVHTVMGRPHDGVSQDMPLLK